jgi:subtilisin family serine protease
MNNLRKLISKRIVFLLIVVLVPILPYTWEYGSNLEVMNRVQNVKQAESLAKKHHLDLLSVSRYGTASYQVKQRSHYRHLLKSGLFHANQINHVDSFDGGPLTNDPLLSQQYALASTGIAEAWAYTSGDSSIVVAVIDTGVDIDHPDLVHAITDTGYNAVTDEVGLIYADDDRGHGTQVAGIIAAKKNNGLDIAGAAENVKIMPIKANTFYYNSSGVLVTTSSFRDSDIIDAMHFAIEQEVDIVNLSLGGSYNSLVNAVMEQAKDLGILIFAAAGNTGGTNNSEAARTRYAYPASYSSVVSVASISDNLQRSFFSTFNDRVELSAPGHNILTLTRNGYTTSSGTSFASPYVASMAALIWSYDPSLTNLEIRQLLIDTAIDLGSIGYDNETGHGLVNVYRAISALNDDDHLPSYPYSIGFDDDTFDQTLEPSSTYTIEKTLNHLFWEFNLTSESSNSVFLDGDTFGSTNHPLKTLQIRSELYQPALSRRAGVIDVYLTVAGISPHSTGQVAVKVGNTSLFATTPTFSGDQPMTLHFQTSELKFGHLLIEVTGLTDGVRLDQLGIYSIGSINIGEAISFAKALEPLDTCSPENGFNALVQMYQTFDTSTLGYFPYIWLDDFSDTQRTLKRELLVNAQVKWSMIQALHL